MPATQTEAMDTQHLILKKKKEEEEELHNWYSDEAAAGRI